MAQTVMGKINDWGGLDEDDPIIDNSALTMEELTEVSVSGLDDEPTAVSVGAPETPAPVTFPHVPAAATVVSSEPVVLQPVADEVPLTADSATTDWQPDVVPAAATVDMSPVTTVTQAELAAASAMAAGSELPNLKTQESAPVVASERETTETVKKVSAKVATKSLLTRWRGTKFKPAKETDKVKKTAPKRAPKQSKARTGKNEWQLVTLALLLVVGVAGGSFWYRRRGGQVAGIKKELVADYRLGAGYIATTGVCTPVIDPSVRASVDDFASIISGDGYIDESVTGELRTQFDFFQEHALGTGARHCFALEYCHNDFANNLPFVLAYARRAYVDTHYGNAGVGGVGGQWVAAGQLRQDVTQLFGVSEVDVSLFPVTNGTINDVYNAADDLFLIPADVNISGPYHYELEKIRANAATKQRVFVAKMVTSDSACQVVINDDHCNCPQTRYYLVQDINPATGEYVYTHEYVQVTGERQKVD